ncbi:hypothetical protein VDG1235_1935 [Verrucomicrobiia bacterium DG1235]|nr:hypothetical protein VDG1235_1935 [Verrucomicrobiae bacterium DG1235]
MTHSAELVIVAIALLLAGVYLARRYLLPYFRKPDRSSPCAGGCGCSATKPKARHQQ